MAHFVIKATDDQGRRLEQIEQAASASELRERYRQQGYWVYEVRQRQALAEQWRLRKQQIPKETLLVFSQQFVTLVKAGLPIPRALELLESRARNPRLRTLLGDVRARVRGGELLSEAFRRQAGIPEIFTTTLMAGERSGNLAEVLNRYIQYQRLALSVRRKLLGAMIYPSVLLCLVVVVLSFLVTYVVPRFGQLYNSLGAKLPSLTVFMLTFGNLTRHYFPLFVVLAALAAMGAGLAWRTPRIRAQLDRWLLRVPVAGEIWWKYQIALMSRTLGTLLLGGIPVVTAIETAGSAFRGENLRAGWRATMRDVREGKAFAESLQRHKVAPPLAVEMIEVGEQTGALPQMLASLAEFYDDDLNNSMTALMALIEPAILIVVGSLVALVLIALYLPIFSLGAGIMKGS